MFTAVGLAAEAFEAGLAGEAADGCLDGAADLTGDADDGCLEGAIDWAPELEEPWIDGLREGELLMTACESKGKGSPEGEAPKGARSEKGEVSKGRCRRRVEPPGPDSRAERCRARHK